MDDWQPTDAELYDAFVGRRRSKAEIAGLSLERVTHMVAYWRKHKVPAEMRDLPLSDEQIAEAITRYAQSVALEEAGWSPAEDGRKQVDAERSLTRVGCGALAVSLTSVAFAFSCWVFANLPPGMPDLAQPFVYGGVALSVIAFAVFYFAVGWHLIKNRRRVTAGRLVEALVVVGVPVALLWLALALTGVPQNATELRLQRAIGIGKCNLASQDLSGYRLAGVDFAGCDLFRADLSGADLADAHLGSANLVEASLSGANLRGADLSSANLSSANLSGANLRGADLIKANFTGADLSGADLGAAYLAYSSLRGADLTEADLSEAMLDFAILSEAKLDETTKIADKWRLVWEIVTHGASNRDLAGADLSWADLRRVDFSGANLAGANLSSSRLNGADLTGADLTGADLGFADLRGTIVSDVQLGQAGTLTGATMSDGSTHE